MSLMNMGGGTPAPATDPKATPTGTPAAGDTPPATPPPPSATDTPPPAATPSDAPPPSDEEHKNKNTDFEDFVKERPEHVPEKFWDKEKGEIRTDDVLKSYSELEKEYQKAKEKPKPPEKYEIKLTEELVKDLGDAKIDEADPYVQGFTEFAKSKGYTQEQYSDMMNWYVSTEIAQGREALVREYAKLGDETTAATRIKTLHEFGKSRLNPQEQQALSGLLKTADQVALMEKLVGMATKQRQLPTDNPSHIEGKLSKSQIDDMMKDERYHDRRHPEYESWNNKVSEAFKRLYGE